MVSVLKETANFEDGFEIWQKDGHVEAQQCMAFACKIIMISEDL